MTTPKFSDWHDCVTDKPTKDGDYLVLRFHNGNWFSGMMYHYTVKYGWNTFEHSSENPISFEEDEPGYESVWAEVS